MIEYTVRVWANGDKSWRFNGKLHREDGPAIERTNGTKEWWINGKLHRIEKANGDKYWYINGKPLTEDEYNNRTKVELSLEEISEKFNIPLDKLRIKK